MLALFSKYIQNLNIFLHLYSDLNLHLDYYVFKDLFTYFLFERQSNREAD